MVPILPIAIDLPERGKRELTQSLHRQLQAAIVDGRLHPGLRLPASRVLAADLGVSRNTVIAAYDLLLSQGYLTGRQGSGTFVAEALTARARKKTAGDHADRRLAPFWRHAAPSLRLPELRRYDFRVGSPDVSKFPFDVWRRLTARTLRSLSRTPADYREPGGHPELRQAIAAHISFARGVACSAGDVIVTTGAQQAFDLLARVLVTPGHTTVAVEDPGYPPIRGAFAAAGAKLIGIPVDDEGLVVDRLPAAQVVLATPSHQSPLGVAMSMRRRTALLDFAGRTGAVVIEDDYDGEFRYVGKPLDALQTLDRSESVFYIGTFSKSLFPGLRIGFVVAPAWAQRALTAAKHLTDWHGPLAAQETLASFIAEGHLARHVRRMRRLYGERRQVLLDAIARHCGAFTPYPSDTGLHMAVRLPDRIAAADLVAAAASHGIGLEDLRRYAFRRPAPNGLALGVGMIRTSDIAPAFKILGRLLARRP